MSEQTNATALRDVLKVLGNRHQNLQDRIQSWLDGLKEDGGPGSGNWGHAGRNGLRGGSAPGGGAGHRMGTKEKGFTSQSKKEAGAREYGKIIKAMDAAKGDIQKKESQVRKCEEDLAQAEEAREEAARSAKMAKDSLKRIREHIKEDGRGRTLEQIRADVEEMRKRYRELDEKRHVYPMDPDEYDRIYAEYEKVLEQLPKENALLRAVDNLEGSIKERDRAAKELSSRKAEVDEAKVRLDEARKELADQYDGLAEKRDQAILKKCQSAEDCETTQEAADYLRARNFFKERDSLYERDKAMNLDGVDTECATGLAKHVEKLMEDYPALKGKFGGIRTGSFWGTSLQNSFACAAKEDGTIILNRDLYSDSALMQKLYQRDVDSEFHPLGDYHSIIDHEFTHQIENILNTQNRNRRRVSDEVMRTTMEKFEERKYAKIREHTIRAIVSDYAYDNRGIRLVNRDKLRGRKWVEDKEYGRNTEFLAEAFAAYRSGNSTGRNNANRLVIQYAGEEFDRIIRERIT